MRHGVDLPGQRGRLEEVREKAGVVASLTAGTGLVPAASKGGEEKEVI